VQHTLRAAARSELQPLWRAAAAPILASVDATRELAAHALACDPQRVGMGSATKVAVLCCAVALLTSPLAARSSAPSAEASRREIRGARAAR
jgi:hypothetical protein